MAYPSAWERLSDAATRVMTAAGLSKDEAQSDICQAIADGAVKIRGKLGRHTTRHSRASETVLEGKDFHVPTTIKSEDLDWEKSRPVKPWMVPRGSFSLPGYWDLEWIEVCRADVTNVLCPARKQNESAKLALSETGATSRSRPALESQETPAGSGPRSTAGLRKSGAARPARHRGPRPKKFEQARDAMRNDLQKGRLSAAGLETMLEKTLAADYGVSRDTARKARKAVLSELGEN